MKQFILKLKEKNLSPNSQLIGGAMWQLDNMPKSLEIRLFWSTSGRGTEDLRIVDSKTLTPARQGKVRFTFNLPNGPYSFSGKLITLTWGVEFIDDSGKHFATETFMLSPNGQEIKL